MNTIVSTLKEIRLQIKNWWTYLLLGIVFLVSGIIVISNPLESYVAIALVFAIGVLLSGGFQVIFAISNRNNIEGWGWQLALGSMEFIIGVVLMNNMELTMNILPFYVGFWLLFRSFALIGFSFELRSYQILDWGLLLIFGIALTLFSWLIILHPVMGGMTIVTWTAIGFFIAAVAHILLAFKLRKVNKKMVQIEEAIE